MAEDDDRHDSNVRPFVPRPGDDPAADPDDADFAELEDLFELDEDEFLAEWEEVEGGAVEVLRAALPGLVGAAPPEDDLHAAAGRIRAGIAAGREPYSYIPGGAGWSAVPPADDRELWIGASGSLIAGFGEIPMSVQRQSTIMALQHGDWAGAVIGLVRAGTGAPAGPADLVEYADDCPEIEGKADPDDVEIIEAGFAHLLELWAATGAIDEHGRLSELGRWGLPRALAWAWNGDFDTGHESATPA
ncbi:hypothetical protein ACRYCC_19980 [Actinomadura scrupuli]|uniref:hypothetical protein n=1 Tax=Actinomadura scrupuli TaxID=559629 RepID=UPI003D97381A